MEAKLPHVRKASLTLIASILVLTALTGSAVLAAVTDQGVVGAELIGTKAPGWEGAEWLNPEPLRLEELRGKVVLVRWWTDTCPYCRRSAPALNEFHARYARRGLIVIGMYHPKPIDRLITASEIREAAQERGFGFPIAIDRNWSVLRRWWPDGGRRSATSVSFLIDRHGVIRHIHPGPAFHREVVRGDERPARDFAELDRMIDQVLDEPNYQ
jgi:thiol-disulfide isomerase/thioredoxin